MSEWPKAPELERALRDLANQVDTSSASKIRTAELLSSDRSVSVVPLDHRPRNASRQISAPAGYLLLAAAAAVFFAGALGVLALRNDDQPIDLAVEDNPTELIDPAGDRLPTSQLDDVDAPSASPSFGNHCSNLPMTGLGPLAIEIAGSTTEVGAAVASEHFPSVIVTDDASWPAIAREHRVHGLASESVGTYYVPESVAAIEAVLAGVCSPTVYLWSASSDADLLCATAPGRGFKGFVLVFPAAPPTECEVRQPVVFVGSADSDQGRAWVDHNQCLEPVQEGASSITTFRSCVDALVIIDAASPDPWAKSGFVDYVIGALQTAR